MGVEAVMIKSHAWGWWRRTFSVTDLHFFVMDIAIWGLIRLETDDYVEYVLLSTDTSRIGKKNSVGVELIVFYQ